MRVLSIYGEILAERERAHAKHGATSMERFPVDDMNRLAILVEEVGEVSKEFNEARHDARPLDLYRLRKELIQVGAMAAAWADAVPVEASCPHCGHLIEMSGPNHRGGWQCDECREWTDGRSLWVGRNMTTEKEA